MFRRLYYDKQTGNIILNYSYNNTDNIIIPTIDQDFISYSDLSVRNKDNVGCKEFTNGEYEQDFRECSGYKVDIATNKLVFTYPDPNNSTAPPIYQKPLTEQVEELKQSIAELSMLLATPV